MAFCVMKHDMRPVNGLDTVVELLPGYYAVGSPRFHSVAPGDSVVIDLVTGGWFHNAFNAPDGMHLVIDGRAVATTSSREPITGRPEQWQLPGLQQDPMVYGQDAYAVNDSLRSQWRPGAYMQIPTPKSVILTGGMTRMPVLATRHVEDERHDYYRVALTGDTALIYTNSDTPDAVEAMVSRRIAESADDTGRIPEAVIEDWADLPYRALMLDIARNYTGLEHVRKVIGLMSRYGLNVLHFHVGDDEGWRVEIPGLPELTQVGSRRGYTTTDDVPFLKQIYSGDGNPESATSPANGYITADEYVELLRWARERGIDIIPEFDSPGHSRAAIRAMEHRYHVTGDQSLRLIHDGDTSRYSTAQYFHDNLMNPALEGPYKFWGMVMDGIKELHDRAGVPLRAIHIGGDEVPQHAWDGSDAAVKFMADNGLTHQRQLHAHFVERLARLAAERGIMIAGWQEIALDHSPRYDATVLPVVAAVNSWTNAGDRGSRMASLGYPVVMSNVDYLYLDQTPTTHPEEPGLTWGGIVDEFRPLHATVDALCPGDDNVQKSVIGISGHLFSETVRDHGMVERYILPKLLAIAERGHNCHPTLTDAQYFGALTAEMQRWTAEGTQCYLRQPGIRLNPRGNLEMNAPYASSMGEIHYTLDGSEPTPQSPAYTGPFNPGNAREVRARLFMGPSWSVTSIIYLDPDTQR